VSSICRVALMAFGAAAINGAEYQRVSTASTIAANATLVYRVDASVPYLLRADSRRGVAQDEPRKSRRRIRAEPLPHHAAGREPTKAHLSEPQCVEQAERVTRELLDGVRARRDL